MMHRQSARMHDNRRSTVDIDHSGEHPRLLHPKAASVGSVTGSPSNGSAPRGQLTSDGILACPIPGKSSSLPRWGRCSFLSHSSSSPKDAVKTDTAVTASLYEHLHLEALDITWLRIDATIKEALHQINLNMFNELLV